jgi:hypothetical protein
MLPRLGSSLPPASVAETYMCATMPNLSNILKRNYINSPQILPKIRG